MPWIRVDDDFYDHKKFDRVGPLGIACWIVGLGYCNRNLTDGFIPSKVARRLIDCAGIGLYTGSMSGRDAEAQDGVDELVAAGLWLESDDPERPGYFVHDYLDYQPSAEKVKAEREKNAERVRKYRTRSNKGTTPVGNDVSNDGRTDVSNTITTDHETAPPVPVSQPHTAAVAAVSSDDAENESQANELLDTCGVTMPDVRDKLRPTILLALAGGIEPLTVKVALAAWHSRGGKPGLLPLLIEEFHGKAKPPVDSRPKWCGSCDEATRMVDNDNGTASRCRICHPYNFNVEGWE